MIWPFGTKGERERERAAAEQRDVGEITSSSPPKHFLFSESQISPSVDPTRNPNSVHKERRRRR